MTTDIDTTSATRAPRATLPEQPGEQLSPPPPAGPAPIERPALGIPPAFAPNTILDHDPENLDVLWKTVRGWRRGVRTLAGLGRYSGPLDGSQPWRIYLYAPGHDAKPDTVHFGFGQTPRDAYRAACREQRLAQHDTADLLVKLAGKQRMLEQALRKIAADGARMTALYNEAGELKARIADLNDALSEKSRRITALEAGLQPKPPRDPGTAVLTLAYLRAWLTNAPLSEIQREGLEVLLALAKPWHARGRAWEDLVFSVTRMGIDIAPTPVELEARRD